MGFSKPKELTKRAEGGGRRADDCRLPAASLFRLPPSAFRPPPSGFTLIEMLIVITIMLLLVTVGLTMMRPDVEGRRIREAARSLNVYLSSARNRAIETGTPCGVTFRLFGPAGSVPYSMTADQCEVPPCYCGDTEQSVAQATYVAGNRVGVTFFDGLTAVTLPNGLIRPGDQIQFNCQGPLYAVASTDLTTSPQTNPVDGNGYVSNVGSAALPLIVTYDTTQVQAVPWATTKTVTYRFYRMPVKNAAEPIQLPAATVVDFRAGITAWNAGTAYLAGSLVVYNQLAYVCIRGSATDPNLGNTPPSSPSYWQLPGDATILFSPNGSVDCIYLCSANTTGTPATDPIYVLVGKRGRMLNATTPQQPPTSANESQWANWQDGGNIWVVINPQTGLVTSEFVMPTSATSTDPNYVNPGEAQLQYISDAINMSRKLARQTQGMGGK